MTKEDYAQYQANVAAFFKREGVGNLSQILIEDEANEPYPSKQPCGCCGTREYGDREDCSGYDPTKKQIKEYAVCSDCVYYCEYGRLDDMTMLEIENS